MERSRRLSWQNDALIYDSLPGGGFQYSSDRSSLLSKVLAFCLVKYSANVDWAVREAEDLLHKYNGLEEELIATLREKYGQPPDELVRKAETLAMTLRQKAFGVAQSFQSPSSAVVIPDMDGRVKAENPIVVRMTRQREVADAMWGQVYNSAKELFASLKNVQERVAMQEVELTRLTDERLRRLREMKEEERAQEATKKDLASAVTRRQLTLLGLRGATQAEERTMEDFRDIEYRRHLLNAQISEEEGFIQAYRRVLRQHVITYPLSPLREEIRRVDSELWHLLQESPV